MHGWKGRLVVHSKSAKLPLKTEKKEIADCMAKYRPSIDFDYDVTENYPEIYHCIRWNDLAIVVLEENVQLREFKGEDMIVLSSFTFNFKYAKKIVNDLPDSLFIVFSEVYYRVDINESFENRFISVTPIKDFYYFQRRLRAFAAKYPLQAFIMQDSGEYNQMKLHIRTSGEAGQTIKERKYDIGSEIVKAGEKLKKDYKHFRLEMSIAGKGIMLGSWSRQGGDEYQPATASNLVLSYFLCNDAGKIRCIDMLDVTPPNLGLDARVNIRGTFTMFEKGQKPFVLVWHPQISAGWNRWALYTLQNKRKIVCLTQYGQDTTFLNSLYPTMDKELKDHREKEDNNYVKASDVNSKKYKAKKESEQKMVLQKIYPTPYRVVARRTQYDQKTHKILLAIDRQSKLNEEGGYGSSCRTETLFTRIKL